MPDSRKARRIADLAYSLNVRHWHGFVLCWVTVR